MTHNGQCSRASLDSFRKKIENYSYSQQDKLGSGYSSQVYRGHDSRNGKIVAIKVVNLQRVREKGLEEMLMREIKLLQELKHENLLFCYDALMTANNCYIVTDYCGEGDLAAILSVKGRIGVDEGLKLIRELTAVLCHLHSKGVIHRDIKPQNILLHEGKLRLADLGFAIRSDGPIKEKYKIGSPLYMSPQALLEKQYSKKNDVWALGVTMYQILEGRAPWSVKDEKQLRHAFKNEIKFKHLLHPDLQQLIKNCLNYDQNTRVTADQVFVKIEEMMGIRSSIKWENKENKENAQSGNSNILENVQTEESKKSIRSNYCLLKWMINFSRFVAKLLPKIENLNVSVQQKEPFVQLTARCLHMTISKLTKIDQYYQQLGLVDFGQFKRTTRFAKLKAVTAQYYQKYFLLLTKLPFKYSLSSSLFLQFPSMFKDSLQKLKINSECNQQSLQVIDKIFTLVSSNLLAKGSNAIALSKLINYQQLIDAMPVNYDEQRIRELLQKKQKLMVQLKEKQENAC